MNGPPEARRRRPDRRPRRRAPPSDKTYKLTRKNLDALRLTFGTFEPECLDGDGDGELHLPPPPVPRTVTVV